MYFYIKSLIPISCCLRDFLLLLRKMSILEIRLLIFQGLSKSISATLHFWSKLNGNSPSEVLEAEKQAGGEKYDLAWKISFLSLFRQTD